MANIFSTFWNRINKKLVPRNFLVEETNDHYYITLQNANGKMPEERENLVTFPVPKALSYTAEDREKMDFVWEKAHSMEGFSDDQWEALEEASDLLKDVNTELNTLKTQTDKNKSGNLATSNQNGYMTVSQVEHLNATVTAPATSTTAGYMSATDKAALDILKQYSQQYVIFYGTDPGVSVTRHQGAQYCFSLNKHGFNTEIAEIDNDNRVITIKEPGNYLILATGCVSPDQTNPSPNALTLRLLGGHIDTNPIVVSSSGSTSGQVTEYGEWLASSNQYIYYNWYHSGTLFTMRTMEVGDQIALCATFPNEIKAYLRHNVSKIILFKTLSADAISTPDDTPETSNTSNDDNDNTQQEG